MANTDHLAIPVIAASQAQKHVSVNEGMLILDAVVQLAVIDRDLATPPGSPAAGDRYIVGPSGTGDWATHDGKIAAYQNSAWMFYSPQEGWLAWVSDEDQLYIWSGTDWVQFSGGDTQNVPLLGVNTTADATNRLSVSSPATLLSNEGAGHQLKINKNAATDTASLLFQTNWSGRAEMGTAGNNDFSIKTSDGTNWFSALECSGTDGRVSLPSGVSGHISVYNTGNSVFLGEGAGENDNLSGRRSVFIGYHAGRANITGYSNSAIGYSALVSTTTGSSNSAVGSDALGFNTTGHSNNAVGRGALGSNTEGPSNNAIGRDALGFNTIGHSNNAVGRGALLYRINGTNNIDYNNCAGLGHFTRVSASNQVQLGNSLCTTYAYGAVQDRSDMRDKADIRDTVLGLDFITKLRPVDFRWDMRDDYFERVEEKDPETGEMVEKLVPIKKDGSRKRNRVHHGLIAQEVEKLIRETGVDFGGFQDHARGGGGDVMSIGYTELISPLIKAVQELAARVDALENK